ncbi:MAG: hypothetical protein QXM97_03425 [Zestosphaera sp.]
MTVASGALSTLFVSGGIEPYMGDLYTTRAFAIAVLGGLTSPFGSFLAGLLFGIFENLSYMTLSLATFYGLYQIDPITGKQIAHIEILSQWQGGKFVAIWPPEIATSKPVYPIPTWDEKRQGAQALP